MHCCRLPVLAILALLFQVIVVGSCVYTLHRRITTELHLGGDGVHEFQFQTHRMFFDVQSC